VHNGNSLNDKIYTNLESNVEDNSTATNIKVPFTKVKIETGNLSKEEELTYSKYRTSNLKKKFNVWRMNLPRISRQWFRYPWAKIKITLNRDTNPEIHNFNVTYLE
jgi:hypothetical protein